jgi:Cys-tRNA(Pro) deacylase
MKVVFYQQEGAKPEFPVAGGRRFLMEERGASEVRNFFEARGLKKEIHSFEESTHNSELAAQTLGVKVGQIAKTILLIVDDTPVIVVISGDRRVDFKKVKALRGGKKVRLGGPEDVVKHTGFKVGAVSPVALPEGIPVYQDLSLRRFETIYPAAGETNNMFVTTPGELLSLTGAQENDLAKTESTDG